MNQTLTAATIQPKISSTIEPGAILYSSWGYEQTNIDFYVVVKDNGNFVWLQRIQSIVEDSGNMTTRDSARMDEVKIAAPAKLLRRKKRGDKYVGISSYASASVWDGKPKYASHYA